MDGTISYVGFARRIDAHLRSAYPNLLTRIYEVETNRFVITFDSAQKDAAEIAEEFDRSIRFVTVPVNLSNEPPAEYLREIPPLSDSEAGGKMVGLPLRQIDLLNLLISRFPDAGIVSVRDPPSDRTIIVTLETTPDVVTGSQIVQFVNSFDWPFELRIETGPGRLPAPAPDLVGPMFVWAGRLRPGAPTYVTRDEAFWFENIEDISSNRFNIDDFPGMRDGSFRCYMDLTLGGNHINLRQALLLYDEIWCSPPLAESQRAFFEGQGLTEADLLQMVDAGRLKFVTTQPEERLNVPFLEAVFEHDGDAILGRRTTAALLVADMAQIAELSYLNDPSLISTFQVLADELSASFGVEADDFLRTFLWPFASRRGGLHGLLDRGSKGGPAMELAKVIAGRINAEVGVDVELEAVLLSEPVHIGHALNATIFGPLDEPHGYHFLKSAIGRHLSFHRCFNRDLVGSWVDNELRRASGSKILPPLPLFEFDRKIPIHEILDDTKLASTRAKGRGLYSRLVELPPEERQREIDDLVSMLRRKARRKSGTLVDLDLADTGLATAGLLLDFVFPPLAALRNFGPKFIERLRRIKKVDQLVAHLEDILSRDGRNQELDFISRISRVAHFRRDRV